MFLVIATQNPIEQEGTYPLSEAQTDRFLLKEIITYPTPEEEVRILDRIDMDAPEKDPPVLSVADVDRVQRITGRVYADASVKEYIARLVDATRHADEHLPEDLQGYVRMGASPRASIAFLRTARAIALMQGRTYVIPDDVKEMCHPAAQGGAELCCGGGRCGGGDGTGCACWIGAHAVNEQEQVSGALRAEDSSALRQNHRLARKFWQSRYGHELFIKNSASGEPLHAAENLKHSGGRIPIRVPRAESGV